MTKSHPYQRLVDPEVCRAKSAAGLSRTVNAVLVVGVVAVLLTVVVIGSLLAYVYLLSAEPCSSSSAGIQPCSSPGLASSSSVDVDKLLERLDSLEREVAALKSECRRWSSSDSGHDNQQSSDQGSSAPEPTTFLQEDVQGKMSPEESPSSTIIPTWPTIPTRPPLDDDLALTLALNSDLELSPRQQHRNPSSKNRMKRRREESPDDIAQPLEEEERGDGGRGDGKKKRDKRCKHCIARVLMFGKAAHVHGNRDGNIPIPGDGWIRGPQMWEMSPSAGEFVSLSIVGSVTVHESGWYYVYSQVLFYDSNNTVGQSICINGQPRFTCVKSNISADAKQSTCYIGGVVHMSEDDQIAIKLSIPNVTVALYADTTYFGLFRVA
ncbi:uncharacterized protein LOC119746008 isoform X2 [Patiria miniata]|uniref:THD domain-containing protein n=1 Tax=Patiria miniata TaxID=46514 RepID=A0A914BR99_PATMI|nr:uncharacterized protein LOC119746008 isoform X2 [Patiria miniata]